MMCLGSMSLTVVSSGCHGESPKVVSLTTWSSLASLCSSSCVGVVIECSILFSKRLLGGIAGSDGDINKETGTDS